MTSYFNTTSEIGPNLVKSINQAESQDAIVYNFFLKRSVPHSPSQVHRIMIIDGTIKPSVPLTSIRRSISVLTKAGKLQMTNNMVTGPFGKNEHTWEVKK